MLETRQFGAWWNTLEVSGMGGVSLVSLMLRQKRLHQERRLFSLTLDLVKHTFFHHLSLVHKNDFQNDIKIVDMLEKTFCLQCMNVQGEKEFDV